MKKVNKPVKKAYFRIENNVPKSPGKRYASIFQVLAKSWLFDQMFNFVTKSSFQNFDFCPKIDILVISIFDQNFDFS